MTPDISVPEERTPKLRLTERPEACVPRVDTVHPVVGSPILAHLEPTRTRPVLLTTKIAEIAIRVTIVQMREVLHRTVRAKKGIIVRKMRSLHDRILLNRDSLHPRDRLSKHLVKWVLINRWKLKEVVIRVNPDITVKQHK